MSDIVERILKVFEEKKLIGKQDDWGVMESAGKFVLYPGIYCCGLGALLIDKELDVPGEHDQESAAVNLLGLSPGYVEGYISGFDGGEPSKDPTNPYAEGFEDGRSTWNALVKKNRVYISEEEVKNEMAEPDYDDGP